MIFKKKKKEKYPLEDDPKCPLEEGCYPQTCSICEEPEAFYWRAPMTYYTFKRVLGDGFNAFYQTLEKWKDVQKDDVDVFIQRLDSLFAITCEQTTKKLSSFGQSTQTYKLQKIYTLFKTAMLNNLEKLPEFLKIKDVKEVNVMSDDQQVVETPQPQNKEEIIKQIEATINNELRFCEETILRSLRGCIANVVNTLNSARK